MTRISFLPLLPLVGLLALTLAGPGCDEESDSVPGEGEGEGGGCAGRRDCPGQICDAGTRRCVDAPASCEGNDHCPPGSLCVLGTCTEGCGNNGDCANGAVCRPISASQNRCFVDCAGGGDCPTGSSCLDDVCIADVVLCAPCETDDDCGGPADRCLEQPGNGKFCAKDCALDHAACPAGYRCRQLAAGADWQCIPAAGDCTTHCQIVGCQDVDRPFCNPDSGRCVETLADCDRCTSDEACGPDARCLTVRGARHCIRSCPDGQQDCPSGFRCDPSGGEPYCVPLSGTCDRCAGAACGPLSPFCNPEHGVCSECLSASDCGLGQTCADVSRLCVDFSQACPAAPATCPEQTPFCFEGNCVECLANNDCPGEDTVCYRFRCYGDDFCQRVTCPSGSTVCDADARACVETSTCTRDEDCGGWRRCDIPNGVCYNADATCVTDAECPLGLSCDRDRRLCQGCSGNADCRVPYQQCVRLGASAYCQQI